MIESETDVREVLKDFQGKEKPSFKEKRFAKR